MAENEHPSPICIIGGISGGIGSALARRLSAQPGTVAGFARSKDRLEALNKDCPDIQTAVCDATDPDALDERIQAWSEAFGRIDAYVHAIGSIYLKPAHSTPMEDFNATIATNLNSAFHALRAVARVMNRQGHGRILFFSTAAARVGIANHEAIAAAKAGIEGMVRSAAATYSGRGLRINAIAPSLTDTPLSRAITGNEQALEFSKRMHPLGTIGEADKVAGLAQWLLSEDADWVTGQVYGIDGGLGTIIPKPRA